MQTLSLIQIYPEPLPAFTEVQRDLAPLLPVVFESLDAGTSVCRQFYEQYCGGDQPRPHLREMIVRDQAKRYMNRNGLRVQELQERRFKLATEPLISLLLHYRGYAIRVLKGRSGIAPGCGTSRKRRAFYNQAPVRFLDEANMPAGSDTNLLALWDFTPEFGLAGLWLACPQVAGSRSQDVVLAWKELLPHPATAVAVDPSARRKRRGCRGAGRP